ncbi:MAG: DUF1015 domain-containing protein [Flavobacteriales bacterium]|nr:DUF1015 domain-containing protein [Flavobacteriales bacterium]MCB9447847.1 DUF1015 domain-containing protein [Flavobacteriales bacterium]
MAVLKPFKGYRPVKDKVAEVASRPYDVLNSEEAKKEAEGKPFSFLHVVKPEIDLPENIDHYAAEVYEKGRDNFKQLLADGVFFQDEKDCYYIYSQTMDGRTQTGIVGCSAVDDYFNDVIKKHELTRPDKEEDRKKHVRVSAINAEPVFFTFPAVQALDEIMEKVKGSKSPEYDFTADDGIRHTLWVVNDDATIQRIADEFNKIPSVYVADGHHRTAAAALVGQDLRKEVGQYSGKEEFNYFLSVNFPDNQLKIFDYNRVVTDLNGLSDDAFMQKLSEGFDVKEVNGQHRPTGLHNFGMFLNGKWYSLTAKAGTYDDNDPIGVLDVTVLTKQVLEPILGIMNQRTDKRIDFVGGIRGLGELEKRVNSGEMKVAFALHPVTLGQLINISDTGNIMPPKTTWFEPKLRSGLVVHGLN